MEKKRVIGLLFISLIVISLFSNFTLAQVDPDKAYEEFKNFLIRSPVLNTVVGILFGIWNPDDFVAFERNAFQEWAQIQKISVLIIYLIGWLILLFVFRDILEIATPFDERVNWLIALGMVVAAAQLKFVIWITIQAMKITAIVGAASVWLLLLTLIIGFIALIWGSNKLVGIGLRMRMARESMRSDKGAQEVADAVEGLRKVEISLKKTRP